MKYLDLYRQYQLELKQIKDKVSNYYSVKEDENQQKLIFLNEDKKKTNVFLLISFAVIMVLFGVVYSFISEYGKLIYLWYYAIIPAIDLLVYWVWNIVLDIEISKLKEKINKIEDKSINDEYKRINNKIYEVCLKIICLNEYYDELICLKDEELQAKWVEIIELRRESIDRKYKYNTTIDTYTEYLKNYIRKNEER